MQTFFRLVAALALLLIVATGCSVQRKSEAIARTAGPTRQLIGERDRGWLRYRFYLVEDGVAAVNHHGDREVKLSIMVVNTKDATSPLRRLCTNLDQYNTYYEYLLNQTKNDLVMRIGEQVCYPVYYAFENNYNSFPFETINVGYRLQKHLGNKDKIDLRYTDKVFSHDTVSCSIPFSF